VRPHHRDDPEFGYRYRADEAGTAGRLTAPGRSTLWAAIFEQSQASPFWRLSARSHSVTAVGVVVRSMSPPVSIRSRAAMRDVLGSKAFGGIDNRCFGQFGGQCFVSVRVANDGDGEVGTQMRVHSV